MLYAANAVIAIAWYEKMPIYYFVVSFIESNENREQSNHSFVYKLFLFFYQASQPARQPHFDSAEQTFILCFWAANHLGLTIQMHWICVLAE